jgi:hypothetical protein
MSICIVLNVTNLFADEANPPFVQASFVTAEPDIDLGEPVATSVVATTYPPASAPPARPAAKLSTTTTHQVAPPPPPRPAAHPNGFGRYVASDVHGCVLVTTKTYDVFILQ